LKLFGAPGQSGIVEASSDLINWTEVNAVFLPDGTTDVIDASATGEAIRFYRFRVQ